MEEVVVAPPRAHEVRIKIICTSVCHTDLTFWRLTRFPAAFPRILGHEAVGVVESVGEHVTEVREGDTVVPTFSSQCGECADCRSDRSNLCSMVPTAGTFTGMPRCGGGSRFTDGGGAALHHLLSVSSFAEYTVVDVANLTKVDPSLPPEIACLLSCGVSTGIGAAWKVADIQAGSTVAVFGLGAVGLAVVEGARIRGAARIIGVDLNPEKFEIGKKLGLTDFINPKDIGEKPIHEVIKEMLGEGADYCFECIGLPSLMNAAFQSSRKGWGKTIILGVEMHGSPMCISTSEILQGKHIIGSLFGGIKAKTDIPALAQKYLTKELQLDEFITHEVDFEDINKAFDLLTEGKSIRCIIWMNRKEGEK